ncbi:hypothetical protein [Sporosarcina sp. Marseille-Q4943]|uniref:hypothetical protein n=1 Tax=Sporosarcina sp. Marseille-Q4943 TaxID=2942204 RepID=UPI00208DB38C|nr:hypothetical protein [Sporosarcina sp. Marseille-Q4943]
MNRKLWFSLLVSMLLVAGCAQKKAEQEPANEENPSGVAVDESEELDGQDPAEDSGDQTIELDNKPPLFDMEDGNLFVYGMKLGDSPSTAEEIWGKPEILEEENTIHGETYHHYPAAKMTIGYYEDKLTFIAVESGEKDLQEITDKFQGDHYRTPEGDAEFFFVPENGQLLIYGTANGADGDAEVRLLMSDENFFYYVDEGIYEKVE